MSNVTNDELCHICRFRLNEPCSRCSVINNDRVDCSIIEGTCGHKFHKHCIDSWLGHQSKCPMASCKTNSFLDNDNE